MPRSTLAPRRFDLFDAALELRDYDAAAVSATAAETGKELNPRQNRLFKAIIDVAAHTSYTAGTNYWTIAIEVSDVVGGTYTQVASIVPDGTAKRHFLAIEGAQVENLDNDCAFVRARAVKTGSPGNLTYGAFLTC